MSFGASGKSASYHYLVEFVLDATTLRYADEDLSVQESNTVGYFYAGRLPSTGTLVRDLGTFLEPHEAIHNFDVQVDNSDGEMAQLIRVDKLKFANRKVRMWLGEGVKKSDYSEVFTGFVAHPNGISWDEDWASFTVIDQRVRHRRMLPANRFLVDTYPNVEAKGRNQPIPIVYGDWGLSAGSGNGSISIPVVCTNMLASQKTFKVCNHGLKSLDRVLKNAVALNLVTQVNNICLTDGTFGIDTSVAYSSTTDTISVNCQGIKTINGSLVEKPMDVLRDLQTSWAGLTATDLNITAYADVNDHTDTEVVRRYIAAELSSEIAIKELLNESQTDMRFVGGKYSPKWRDLDTATSRKDFREHDILLQDVESEKADFSVVQDPDRMYANKIRARYRYDSINALYDGSYTRQVTLAVSEVSAIVERAMDFSWYYRQTDTENRVDRELATFTKETTNIRAGLGLRALTLNLADQIDLTYDVFTDNPVQIRRMEVDLGKMTTRISGFNLFMFGMGRWTAADAPAWNSADLEERASQGFWCDSSGFASASDTTSQNVSRWGY